MVIVCHSICTHTGIDNLKKLTATVSFLRCELSRKSTEAREAEQKSTEAREQATWELELPHEHVSSHMPDSPAYFC